MSSLKCNVSNPNKNRRKLLWKDSLNFYNILVPWFPSTVASHCWFICGLRFSVSFRSSLWYFPVSPYLIFRFWFSSIKHTTLYFFTLSSTTTCQGHLNDLSGSFWMFFFFAMRHKFGLFLHFPTLYLRPAITWLSSRASLWNAIWNAPLVCLQVDSNRLYGVVLKRIIHPKWQSTSYLSSP